MKLVFQDPDRKDNVIPAINPEHHYLLDIPAFQYYGVTIPAQSFDLRPYAGRVPYICVNDKNELTGGWDGLWLVIAGDMPLPKNSYTMDIETGDIVDAPLDASDMQFFIAALPKTEEE